MKVRSVIMLLCVFAILLCASPAAAALTTPSLVAPAAGANLTSPLTISWSAASDPSGILGYNWQVSTSSTFANIVLQNSTSL